MFVSLFLCKAFSVGQMRHVRMAACMHAYACASMWRGGCMCSVGTAGVRVARFQSLDGDGGGTLPRGKHMERGKCGLGAARMRPGDWAGPGRKEGVWPGRDYLGSLGVEYLTTYQVKHEARRRETPPPPPTKGDGRELCVRPAWTCSVAGIEREGDIYMCAEEKRLHALSQQSVVDRRLATLSPPLLQLSPLPLHPGYCTLFCFLFHLHTHHHHHYSTQRPPSLQRSSHPSAPLHSPSLPPSHTNRFGTTSHPT